MPIAMFAKAPLLFIAIPFIAGILLTNILAVNFFVALGVIIVITILLYAIPIFLRSYPVTYIKITPLLTILVTIASIFAGWQAGTISVAHHLNLDQINGKTIIARIDHINNKNFSMAVEATILSCPERHSDLTYKTPIAITIRGNDYSLLEGDLISFKANLSTIRSLGNPDGFDYALYMERKGIRYTQLLRQKDYDKIGENNNIFTHSRHIQRSIIAKIINSNMSAQTQRFLCAILLGDASFIEPDTRTQYSQAGISHILALSGLHMGIIVGILFLLLKPLCYIGLYRIRIMIVIPALMAYLFITGMMPSATRSAIMVLFILVANLFYRQNSSFNALVAAALVILATSPNSIYNVGFQLSFAAVLTILLFYNKLLIAPPRKKILHFLLSSITLTTVATLGTAAISTYYFHVIPLLSIFSNLIILPFLPAYLCLALLHTILLCSGIEISIFSQILDLSTAAIDYIAKAISEMPHSSVSNVHIPTTAIILIAALYLSTTLWIYRKKFSYALCSLATILAISITCLLDYLSLPRAGLVIQNDFTSTPIIYFNNGYCKVWCPDDSIDINEFNRNNIGFLSHYGIDSIAITTTCSSQDVYINPPFAFVEGIRLAVVSSTQLRHLCAENPVEVDYLVIATSYYGRISDLLDTFSPRCIVLSGGIYDNKYIEYRHEMETIPLPLYDISTNGALFIRFP